MCEKIDELVEALGVAVSSLDPAALSPEDATRLVEAFARAERFAVAGRTLASARVLASRAWRASGYRTAAQWVASRTGSPLGDAIRSVETARALSELPATREALVSGQLSGAQAAEIVSAASVDRGAEQDLLALSQRESFAELRERARAVRAAASPDQDSTERIRLGRYLRHWSDPDGAVRLDGRLAPQDAAPLLATVGARAEALAAQGRRSARAQGRRPEPMQAHMADALCALASGAAGPRGVVHVTVDLAAWERGRARAGETCQISGVGPVPVAVAKRLAADSMLKVLVRHGVDVTRVAHAGRGIPAHLRTALEARDPVCVVPGCGARTGLEIDHIVPLSEGGLTCLENLCRLCRYHHAAKTHHGWQIAGPPGRWSWTGPPDPVVRRKGRAPPARAP